MNKNKQNNQPIVSILTLGCSKNVVDSENLIALLGANQIEVTDKIESSDTLIINTCGFIGPAKQESIDLIVQASELKKQGKINKLIVMGCLSQRYSEQLSPQLTQVDAFFGVDSNFNILKEIAPNLEYCNSEHKVLLTPSHYSYLKISEGCNHECAFCAIPLIRGKYKSRPINSILEEATYHVNNGVKEINLIAQDSTYYGRDIDGKSHLAELLEIISEKAQPQWLRLHYAYPTAFPVEVLKTIAQKSNICNYIDIPFQHISDKVLKAMRRGTSNAYIEDLIKRIRDSVPNVAIRSTFIVGFPGETQKDYEQLYNFIERIKLDRVGVFTYSHEDGTHAFSMIDTVPAKEKEKRRNSIMQLQQSISLDKNQNKIGQTFKVLIDSGSEGKYTGRTEYDAPEVDNLVHFTSADNLQIGNFTYVQIEKAEEYDLYGYSVKS